MAIVEVKVPQLSESVAEATMLTWKKKAGGYQRAGPAGLDAGAAHGRTGGDRERTQTQAHVALTTVRRCEAIVLRRRERV